MGFALVGFAKIEIFDNFGTTNIPTSRETNYVI